MTFHHGNPMATPFHLCFQLSFWWSGMQEIVTTGSMHSWVKHTRITNLQLWPTHQHSMAVPTLIVSYLLHTSNSFTDSSTLIILNSFSPCPSMVIPLPVLVILAVDSFPTEEYSWSDWTVLELTGPLVDAISSTTHEWPTKIISSTLQNSVPCMRA